MDPHSLTLVHTLPFWFLVFSLFLPRIALAVDWLQGGLAHFHLDTVVKGAFGPWVPVVLWLLLPRLLILYLIYVDQGASLWFVIHLVVALLVWGGSGGYHSRRWRRDDR
jgi:hypothetical protein